MPLFVLYGFSLLPWLVVPFGFYVLHELYLAILGYAVGCCGLPVLYAHRYGETQFKENSPLALFPLGMPRRRLLGFSFLLFVVIVLSWFGLAHNWVRSDINSQLESIHLSQDWLESSGIGGMIPFYSLAIYFVTINPLVEEWFWRGLVYTRLKKSMSLRNANLISSTLFGAWHWVILQHFIQAPYAILMTLGIIAGGAIFATLYEETKTLGASVILHGMGADLAAMVMLWDLLRLN